MVWRPRLFKKSKQHCHDILNKTVIGESLNENFDLFDALDRVNLEELETKLSKLFDNGIQDKQLTSLDEVNEIYAHKNIEVNVNEDVCTIF